MEEIVATLRVDELLKTPASDILSPLERIGAYPMSGNARKRGINSAWRKIIAEAAKGYPNSYSLDEWEVLAGRVGENINRNTLRSQMSNYAKVGLVERISIGRFRVTEAGARAAKAELPSEPNEPPAENRGRLSEV